jgi:hypothetical protein
MNTEILRKALDSLSKEELIELILSRNESIILPQYPYIEPYIKPYYKPYEITCTLSGLKLIFQ